MKKAIAEFIGTFTLVLFGCGAAVIAGPAVGATTVGVLGIAFAFGLAIVAMAYGIGRISGCHVNPAVSLGVYVAGRMTRRRLHHLLDRAGARRHRRGAGAVHHHVGQGVGLGRRPRRQWLGRGLSRRLQSALGPHLRAGRDLPVRGRHPRRDPQGRDRRLRRARHRPDADGDPHLGINVTGVSVNPARSIGPALFSGGTAMAQLWLFIIVPLVGGAIAGAAVQGRRADGRRSERRRDTRRPGGAPASRTGSAVLASSASMAATIIGSSGTTSGSKRATTSPLRPTRNFSKFQRISGLVLGGRCRAARRLGEGAAAAVRRPAGGRAGAVGRR